MSKICWSKGNFLRKLILTPEVMKALTVSAFGYPIYASFSVKTVC